MINQTLAFGLSYKPNTCIWFILWTKCREFGS